MRAMPSISKETEESYAGRSPGLKRVGRCRDVSSPRSPVSAHLPLARAE